MRQIVTKDDVTVEEVEAGYRPLITNESSRVQAVKELSAFYLNKELLRQAYTLQYENASSEKEQEKAYAEIEKLTKRMLNRGEMDYEGRRYIIKSGDTLEKIAKREGSLR